MPVIEYFPPVKVLQSEYSVNLELCILIYVRMCLCLGAIDNSDYPSEGDELAHKVKYEAGVKAMPGVEEVV